MASLVHGLKFFKKRNLVKILAPLLVETFQENWSRKAFDLILPVPLHAKRKRDRGYNQSELLAKILAARIGIPVDAKILTRIRATVSQVGLSNLERRANVRKAFSCLDPERVAGLRILLIDDVMTTGATAASASKALLKSGARRVSVLTLARTE
ncbi:MAG: ComF family protein [Acidobacteriota bacterium]